MANPDVPHIASLDVPLMANPDFPHIVSLDVPHIANPDALQCIHV
jgi:hypothetical protein